VNLDEPSPDFSEYDEGPLSYDFPREYRQQPCDYPSSRIGVEAALKRGSGYRQQ
jgi:hypothetical protein